MAGLLAAVLMAAAAGPARAEQLAVPTVFAAGIDFQPNVAFREARITVSGQGLTWESRFSAGEALSIGLFDPDGHLLPDGTYDWRLELTPTRAEARKLQQAARRNPGEASSWQAESGTFAIRDGLLADPSVGEGSRSRPATRPFEAAMASALDLQEASPAAMIAADSDGAAGEERRMRAAAQRQAPAAAAAGQDSDAATAAAPAAAPQRAADETPSKPRRSWPTDGKNGRD